MAASKIEVPLSSEPRVYGRSRGSDYATYRRRRRHEGRQSLEGACRVVLLSREWGDPFPGLSQQRSGPLAIAGSSTYQGGAALDTPPDTFPTAFDPPGGDFHSPVAPRQGMISGMVFSKVKNGLVMLPRAYVWV